MIAFFHQFFKLKLKFLQLFVVFFTLKSVVCFLKLFHWFFFLCFKLMEKILDFLFLSNKGISQILVCWECQFWLDVLDFFDIKCHLKIKCVFFLQSLDLLNHIDVMPNLKTRSHKFLLDFKIFFLAVFLIYFLVFFLLFVNGLLFLCFKLEEKVIEGLTFWHDVFYFLIRARVLLVEQFINHLGLFVEIIPYLYELWQKILFLAIATRFLNLVHYYLIILHCSFHLI